MMPKLTEVLSAGPTTPIRATGEFLAAFNQREACRFDSSAVAHDEALELAAVVQDWISDLNDGWIECSGSQHLEYARSFVELCHQIETAGYGHRSQQAARTIGLRLCSMWVTILPKKHGYGIHYAIVQLEGAREASESDRMLMEFYESGRRAPDRRR